MTSQWRLIAYDGPADGAWNMALDRAIQLSCDSGDSPPTLRLYRWLRPTVTLGRFQKSETIDRAYCATNGIDVVRRFTGGRGVLHDDELTYSLVCGTRDGIPRGVAASYRVLCAALAEAYRILGVEAALTATARGDRSSAACYLHATSADLSIGAQKLSGSAQVWSGDTVLQHGSFTISRDVAAESRVFRLDEDAAALLATRTATLSELLQPVPDISRIAQAVEQGVSRSLGITLVAGTTTDKELELAHELLSQLTLVQTDATDDL